MNKPSPGSTHKFLIKESNKKNEKKNEKYGIKIHINDIFHEQSFKVVIPEISCKGWTNKGEDLEGFLGRFLTVFKLEDYRRRECYTKVPSAGSLTIKRLNFPRKVTMKHVIWH